MVDVEREYRKPSRKDLKKFWDYDPEDEEREIGGLAQKLMMIRSRGKPTRVEFDEDARRILFNYKEVMKRRAIDIYGEDKFDARANYLSRLAEFAMKKAGLHTIARLYDAPQDIVVDCGDALFGVCEAQKAYRSFLRMQELQQKYKTGEARRRSQGEITRDKITICLKMGGELSAKEISEVTRIPLRTVQRHLKRMAEEEGLVEKTATTKGNRWRLK